MATQAHHLIPINVIRTHPLFQAMRAGNPLASTDPLEFLGFKLNLPDKASAAAAGALATAPAATHEGRHWKAYDRLVETYLNIFEDRYAEPDGNGGFRLKANFDIDALTHDLQSLEVRLADWHTGTIGADGKLRSPEIILNSSDYRITSGQISVGASILKLEQLAANAANDVNSNTSKFRELYKMRAALPDLNVGGDKRTGLDYVYRKMRIALDAGFTHWNDVDITKYVAEALREKGEKALARLGQNASFQRLEEVFNKLKHNQTGSVEVGGKLLGLSNKLGAVDFMAIGILGLSLYQIAKEADVDVEDVIDALDIEVTPQMLADATVGVIKMVFENAVLTMATGGLGTVLRMAYLIREAVDSLDLIKLSLEVYKIAFPDGVLADIIEAALPDELGAGESFARSHVKSEKLFDYFGIDFAKFNTAQSVIIADDADGDANTRILRLAEALGTNPGAILGKDKNGNPIVSDGTDIMWGRNGATILGRGGSDLLFHTGYGRAEGGEGNDVVIGQEARFIKQGAVIDPGMQAKADAQRLLIASITAQNVILLALGLPALEVPGELPDSPRALNDLQLTLDGGAGNDMVIAIHDGSASSVLLGGSGDRAITIGGLGRDWIYNTSKGGVIYGDTQDGLYEKPLFNADGTPQLNADGSPKTAPAAVEASSANADNFWYAPDVTLMDAQQLDVLKFYGITLTGGEVGASAWSLAAGALSGNVTVASGASGLTALAAAAVNASRARQGKAAVYYDSWLPFMAYTTQTNADGKTDLIVANMVDRLLGLTGLSDSNGFMVVKNYHMVKSSAGGNNFASGFKALGITPGDLGMVFRDFNPVAFLAAAAPLLAGVPIVQSLMAVYQVTALADSAAWTAAHNDNDNQAWPERTFRFAVWEAA